MQSPVTSAHTTGLEEEGEGAEGSGGGMMAAELDHGEEDEEAAAAGE